jgi:hypothetical protein
VFVCLRASYIVQHIGITNGRDAAYGSPVVDRNGVNDHAAPALELIRDNTQDQRITRHPREPTLTVKPRVQ